MSYDGASYLFWDLSISLLDIWTGLIFLTKSSGSLSLE
jgi:hypothetical protein